MPILTDPRCLGLPQAAREAYPHQADIPLAADFQTAVGSWLQCPSDEHEQVLRTLSWTVMPIGSIWVARNGRDWAQRAPWQQLRLLLEVTGWTGRQAADMVGVEARGFRRWLSDPALPGARDVPYAPWRILIEDARKLPY